MIYIHDIDHCFSPTALVDGEYRRAEILRGKACAGQSYHTSGGYIAIVLLKHQIHAQEVWIKIYIGIGIHHHSQNIVLPYDLHKQ